MGQAGESIRDIVRRRCGEKAPLDDATPLFAQGLGFDSIGFLLFVIEVEEALGLRLRDEALDDAALASLGAFIAHVEAQIGRVREP